MKLDTVPATLAAIAIATMMVPTVAPLRRRSRGRLSIAVIPEGSRPHPAGPRHAPDSVGRVVVVTQTGTVVGMTLHIVDPCLQSASTSLVQKASGSPAGRRSQ